MRRVEDRTSLRPIRNPVLVSQSCWLSGHVYNTGWRKTVGKTAWGRCSPYGPVHTGLTGWLRRDPGPHLPLRSRFEDTAGTAEPQSHGRAILFKSTVCGLKTYPEPPIIESRAGKCPPCSNDEEIILGPVSEGLEGWKPAVEASCAFEGPCLQMGTKKSIPLSPWGAPEPFQCVPRLLL